MKTNHLIPFIAAAFICLLPTADAREVKILTTQVADTKLGTDRMDNITKEFAKHGVAFAELGNKPEAAKIDITFIEYSSEGRSTLADITGALKKEGYRIATAKEASSLDVVPELDGKMAICIGTMRPLKDDQFLTVGLKYQKTPQIKDGIAIQFLTSKHGDWKGTVVIPAVKI